MNNQHPNFFYEQQRMRQLWLWIVALAGSLILFSITGYMLYQRLALGHPLGNTTMSTAELIIFSLITIAVGIGLPLLLYSMHLTVWVSEEYIHIRYFPFIRKRIPLRHIAHAGLRTYHPILEYGGWGIRMSLRGRGWAFNVSGNRGIQLYFKSGKRLLIGSQKPEELFRAIAQQQPSAVQTRTRLS